MSSNGLSRRLFILTTKTSGVNDWLLVVGTNRWTTDVRVLVPTSYESEIATKLRAILLSVDSIPGDTRPVDSVGGFHLAESKLLIPAQVTGLIVDYTLTGDMKLKSAADPLMQFRALTFEGKKGSEEEIANSLLNSIYAISNVEVTTRQPIELAGMHGVEIEATGQKTKAATPVAIYQLVLFREKGNLTVHGTVGTDAPERETTLAEFRRMARGLTRE